jgi:hypothetical protein
MDECNKFFIKSLLIINAALMCFHMRQRTINL